MSVCSTRLSFAVLALLLVGYVADSSIAQAADDDKIAGLLAHEIIGPHAAQAEIELFTESRVRPLPQFDKVADWEAFAQQARQQVLERVVFRGEAKRWRDAKTKVDWQDPIAGGPGYRIRKLRFEALPGLWIPALLYEPEHVEGKVPVFLNVNGHDPKGKAAPYKQLRSINQAKRGILALNVEWFRMGQLEGPGFVHYRMNQIDLCGTSGLAPFYLAMSRALDLLLALEHADPTRVGVAGLSGGGWQTIFISSLDPRVTLSNPVAGYSSFRTRARYASDLGDSEQTPVDLAATADYALLTAMRAPRPTLLTFNAKDNCCFASGHALSPLMEAAMPVFKLYGRPEALRSHVNEVPGTHNFEQENREALYSLIGDFFFAGSSGFDAKEIPSEKELKTADELKVAMPEKNENFHTLAMKLAASLPLTGERAPKSPAEARRLLAEIVRTRPINVTAKRAEDEKQKEIEVAYWQFKSDLGLIVPAVELKPAEARGTTILLADGGRKTAADDVRRLLDARQRVIAVDPFYFGESKIEKRDFLYALFVSSVGERPLGIQARQVAAIGNWARRTYGGEVRLAAIGPRTSLIATVAAALEPQLADELELTSPLYSLKQVIDEDHSFEQMPEAFCFGLLERFDVRSLVALAAPKTLVLRQVSPGAKTELAADKLTAAGLTGNLRVDE